MGMDREQDQVSWAGWTAEKQMEQSGYGGVLNAAVRREVRSSATRAGLGLERLGLGAELAS
jgi:hypothetical protein